MAGRYWISWLLFLASCAGMAWWFSRGSAVVGFVIFAVLTIPISLWARAKSIKFDPTEGTQP